MAALACLSLLSAPARAQGTDSARLTWTAPADGPGADAVARYDVRALAIPITLANFSSAVTVPSGVPRAPGQPETLAVNGLVPGRSYWFAIRSIDRAGNVSALSNVVAWNPPLDTSPPAAPVGVTCSYDATTGNVSIEWQENSEPDLAGYNVYRATDPLGTWTPITGAPLPVPSHLDPAASQYGERIWYAVSATDWSHNEGARAVGVVVIRGAQTAYPATWHLNAPFPNPARSGAVTHLPIEAPVQRGAARLEILDAANQVVRHFDVGASAPGYVQVDWDGRNDHGAPCAPGIYRAQLITGDARQIVRVARVP